MTTLLDRLLPTSRPWLRSSPASAMKTIGAGGAALAAGAVLTAGTVHWWVTLSMAALSWFPLRAALTSWRWRSQNRDLVEAREVFRFLVKTLQPYPVVYFYAGGRFFLTRKPRSTWMITVISEDDRQAAKKAASAGKPAPMIVVVYLFTRGSDMVQRLTEGYLMQEDNGRHIAVRAPIETSGEFLTGRQMEKRAMRLAEYGLLMANPDELRDASAMITAAHGHRHSHD